MSSWHTSQLSYAFGIGGMMSFYGIVGVIVYMLPPSSVGNTEKIVIIALVLLTLPFALLIAFFGARRRKKREAADAAAAEAASAADPAAAVTAAKTAVTPTGKYPELEQGISETVQFLRSSSLGDGGKDALYSLPWYIVAGPPRSGKTSLIVGSDLDFQTLPSQRQSEQKFIRATTSVNWRVTSEAVFIDTSGRYQTEGADSDEWSALLELIRKNRPDRPIDGILIAVDVEQIIKGDDRGSEELAKVLRTRIDDAIQRLKVRFPVYTVFTHADGIEGFRDSFSISKNDGRSLVWGSTIPLEKGENGQSMFDAEFELLHNSAMKRRLLRLSAPFPPVRQLRIFNFPLHFGSARRKIGAFVATLFRPNPFSENPLFRGFYFSASPAAKSSPNAPQTVADTYFTHRFFRDVLLRDKDVVRAFQAQKQGAPLLGWASILLGAALAIILLALSGVSLYNNKKMLEDARSRGEALIAITQTQAYKDPAKADEKATRNEIEATESLRELIVKLDDYERNGAPWYMRFGLYSGNRVYKQHLLKVYMDVIEHRYKTATIAKVQADLKKFSASNPVVNPSQLTDAEEALLGKNYDLLKAYLMLAGPYKDKADSAHIASALKDYWTTEGKIPSDLKPKAALQLEFWAKQVDRDDEDYGFPRIPVDDKLVAETRAKLQAFPAVFRYYKRKVTEISKTVDEKVGPTTVDAILARNGADARFLDGAYQVRSIFTRSGNELMKKAIAEADEKLSEDDWVMGEVGKSKIAQTTDSKKLEDRYYRDYADEWRAFAKGITVRQYKTKEDAAAALQVFSLENSPMKVLMIEIARNTNLSAPPEVVGWWDWIKSFFVSQENANAGGTPPEKEFQPLFEFVGKKGQKDRAPVDNYGAALQNVYKNLNGISVEKLKQVSDDLANEKDDGLKLVSNERAITGMIQSFTTSSTQELATVLQQPLGNLKSLLGQGAQDQLKKVWNEQIMPAAKEIEKGFPFEDGQTESDLTKLTAFLNPTDGKLSKFYDERLKKYFEESNGQLKLKDTAEIKFSDEFVAYLNNAFALRKALYGSGNTPKFEYAFALKVAKDSLVEVAIDGQKVTSEGTASINGSFPAAQSAETGVIVSSGASGSTSTGPPAGTSNTPVPLPPSSDSSSLKFPGTWGLFRFVDAGRPQKQAGGEYNLSYSVGGRSVSATIKPSGGDLFDKSIFKRVRAPQNMLK